jgi:TPP-dependent pyruvate/acetoin dehydrogenase alpha subunit
MQINYNETNEVVVAFMGDGAINAGGCHEGMNLAAVQKAPVIFICENNGIAVSTKIENMIPLKKISQRAAGYGMPGVTVDGTDVLEVYETVMGFIDRVRGGAGPVFIEAVCHRANGHTAWDPAEYRTEAENNEWKKHDPIKKLKQKLVQDKIFSPAELDFLQKEAETSISRAVEFAKNGPEIESTAEEALRYVYA